MTPRDLAAFRHIEDARSCQTALDLELLAPVKIDIVNKGFGDHPWILTAELPDHKKERAVAFVRGYVAAINANAHPDLKFKLAVTN